jgi:hypothetical protein
MLMCEFLTAVQHKLPVKAVVFNNSALGMIALEAEQLGIPAYYKAIDFPNPDYVAYSRVSHPRIPCQTASCPRSPWPPPLADQPSTTRPL